jgi:hypothetical protein
LLILAFTCRNPALSPAILSRINASDVIRTPKGLELLLPGRANRVKQYVTIPADDDRLLCPVRAMSDWQAFLRKEGFAVVPLFSKETDHWNAKSPRRRLTGHEICRVFKNAVYRYDLPWSVRDIGYVQLATSASPLDFLDDLTLRIHGGLCKIPIIGSG